MTQKTKSNRTSPFCLRLTIDEYARVKVNAGEDSMSAYARSRLLKEEHIAKRTKRKPVPASEVTFWSKRLAVFQSLNLASNMNQIAKSINCGQITDLSSEQKEQVNFTCIHIREMRDGILEIIKYSSRI